MTTDLATLDVLKNLGWTLTEVQGRAGDLGRAGTARTVLHLTGDLGQVMEGISGLDRTGTDLGALRVLAQARAVAAATTGDSAEQYAAAHLAATLALATGDPESLAVARTSMQQARDLLADEDASTGAGTVTDPRAGQAHAVLDSPTATGEEKQEAAQRLVELADEADDLRAMAESLLTLGDLLRSDQQMSEMYDTYQSALEAAVSADATDLRIRSTVSLASAQYLAGDKKTSTQLLLDLDTEIAETGLTTPAEKDAMAAALTALAGLFGEAGDTDGQGQFAARADALRAKTHRGQ